MVFVRKANVILEVKDDAVQRMKDMGYDVIDTDGNIIEYHNPDDVKILKARIAELEAENVELKKKLNKPTARKQRNNKQ